MRSTTVYDIRPNGSTAVLAGASRAARAAAATALADNLRLDLYRVDLSVVEGKYIGETEKNLDRLLARVDDLGVLLFFDEADALFGTRTTVASSDGRTARRRRVLLARMEGHNGLVVLGVTAAENIDASVLRGAPIIVEVDPQLEVGPEAVVVAPVRTTALRTAAGAAAGAALVSAAARAMRRARD